VTNSVFAAGNPDQSISRLQLLYIVAALTTASGVPWALTALRRTNGALSIRAKRYLGPYNEPNSQPLCITYASREKASIDRELNDPKYKSTKALVNRWRWHNDLRTVLLVLGTVVGAVGIMVEK